MAHFMLKKIDKRLELIDLDKIEFHTGYRRDLPALLIQMIDRDLDKGYYDIEVVYRQSVD